MTTNLLFALVTTVVTNTAESPMYKQVQVPCPDSRYSNFGCAVLHWGDDIASGPVGKHVITICSRVTNLVEVSTGRNPGAPRIIECGQCELWRTVDAYQMNIIVTTQWTRITLPIITMTNNISGSWKSNFNITNLTFK